MAHRKSRAEAEIEAQLATLDPDSERYAVLSAARDFKAAWVRLGDLLTRVRENGTWRDWGYASFDTYVRRELRVKRDTANKLTRSFAFLRDHEPAALESSDLRRELPPLDVVDVLSQAREKTKLTDQQLDEVRMEVFAEDAKVPTKSQVVRRLREIDPEAFRTAPRQTAAPVEGDVRKALLLAERLQALVDVQEGLTDRAREGMSAVVTELKAIFEAQQAQNEEMSA